jgi:hypothetical protein
VTALGHPHHALCPLHVTHHNRRARNALPGLGVNLARGYQSVERLHAQTQVSTQWQRVVVPLIEGERAQGGTGLLDITGKISGPQLSVRNAFSECAARTVKEEDRLRRPFFGEVRAQRPGEAGIHLSGALLRISLATAIVTNIDLCGVSQFRKQLLPTCASDQLRHR